LLRDLHTSRDTLVVLVDILNDYVFLALLFFESICCCFYGAGLEKTFNLFFIIGVSSCGTSWKFLEIIPIVDYFVAAGPSFFEVVEDRLSRMEVACSLFILGLVVVFEAAVALTSFIGLHYIYKLNIIKVFTNALDCDDSNDE